MKRRIRKKLSKKAVDKMVKQIEEYKIPFKHYYGLGYFVFSFDAGEYNLHIIFKDLPMIKFGIWKIDNKFEFFGEHIYYIDKFKPSASELSFSSLDDMMNHVKLWINDKKSYLDAMVHAYYKHEAFDENNNENETYQDVINDFILDEKVNKEYYENSLYRNGLSKEEYYNNIKSFNNILKNLDEDWDIFYKNSDCYNNIYDVWFYLYFKKDCDITEEEIEIKFNNLYEQLESCNCNCFGDRDINNIKNTKYMKKNFHWKIHPNRIKRYNKHLQPTH